jgi:hypothetical protein
MHNATQYRTSPGLGWAVETRGIALYCRERGVFAHLDYPAAAIWDLASRGSGFDRISELMVHIAGVDRVAAEKLVRQTLDQWVTMGLLREEVSDG